MYTCIKLERDDIQALFKWLTMMESPDAIKNILLIGSALLEIPPFLAELDISIWSWTDKDGIRPLSQVMSSECPDHWDIVLIMADIPQFSWSILTDMNQGLLNRIEAFYCAFRPVSGPPGLSEVSSTVIGAGLARNLSVEFWLNDWTLICKYDRLSLTSRDLITIEAAFERLYQLNHKYRRLLQEYRQDVTLEGIRLDGELAHVQKSLVATNEALMDRNKMIASLNETLAEYEPSARHWQHLMQNPVVKVFRSVKHFIDRLRSKEG